MSEKLIIEVNLTKGNTKTAFQGIEKDAKIAGKKAGKELSEGIKKGSKGGIKSLGRDLLKTTALVAVAAKGFQVLKRAVSASFENLRTFQRSVAEINTILPKNTKLTDGQVASLQKLSNAYGTDQQTQARAFYNIVSSGVKGATAQFRTLAIANKAAIAGLVSIDESAKLLVSSVNAYASSGLTATQASDSLFAAVREGQTTFQELSNFMGNATAIASAANVKFSELAGALAFVTKQGIQTDRAAIGLRQVFTSVIKPTKEAADEATRIGLAFNTSAIEAKGFAGFLKDVAVRTKGNQKSLAKLFGNVRALAPILSIVNNDFAEFERILGETENSLGDTSDAAKIMKDTLDFDLKQSGSQLATLGTNIMALAEGPIRFLVKRFTQLTRLANKGLVSNAAVSKTDEYRVKIAALNKTIRELKEEQKDLSGAKKYGAEMRRSIEVAKLLETAEAELSANRRKLLNAKLAAEKDANKKTILAKVTADAELLDQERETMTRLGSLGLTKLENIERQRALAIQKLRDELLTKEGMVGEFMAREAVLQSQFDEKAKKAAQERALNQEASFKNMGQAFNALNKQTKITAGAIAKTTNNVLVQGIGNGMTKIGESLRDGTDGMIDFAAAMEQMFGNLASSLGDFYIAKGIALSADPMTPGSGASLIAAGSALKVLGGYLSSAGGGSTGGSSGGASGGNNVANLEPDDVERQTSSEINVVVEGSLVGQDELGQFLSDVISESNEKNGNVILNQRFA